MTVRGYVKGENAGTFRVATTTYTASGSTISSVDRYTKSGGKYDWQPFSVDFTLPSNAVDFRIYLRQSAPNSGEGQVFVDDVEVIQWETLSGDTKAGLNLPTTNDYGFVRLRGVSGSTIGVTLTHSVYAPK